MKDRLTGQRRDPTKKMKSSGTPFLIAVVALTTTLFAQLPAAWRHWRYATVIEAGEIQAERLISVLVSPDVTSHAQADWGDLRVIDDTGREVPYVLHARFGGRRIERREARVLEPSFVPHKYAQIIVDAGSGGAIHNAVRLHVDAAEDLLTWVEIAVSNEASEWRVVRERGPFFKVKQDGEREQTEVSYPDTPARYLRARVLEDPARYKLTGAEIGFETSRPGERIVANLPLAPVRGDPRRSIWQSPAGAAPHSLSEIRFQTPQQGFARAVTVDWSDDGKHWMQAGAGEIFRTTESGNTRETLAIAFPERRATEWRVSVFNGNDAALSDLVPAAFATPRRVIFRQEPGRRYSLIYGHPRASAPQYDIARLIDEPARDSAADVRLGVTTTNETYDDPTPWSEQHPIVMWAALAVVVIVLGGLAVRALKGSV